MGNSFRPQPGPAIYPTNKTPVAEDILEVGLIMAFAIIAFSFVLIIPGIRGWERLWAVVRVFVALWIGCVLLVCNFGREWYSDTQCIKSQYKAYVFPPNSPQEIEAVIGLHIGLRGINITLKEMPLAECLGRGESTYNSNRPFPGEIIQYEEDYDWANPFQGQGRIGFGRFSNKLNREFRASQFRGTPYPILWVAEYFTLDGEQIRWGRKFRVAGWYTHIFLWLAFALYLLSILLYIFVIKFGAIFTIYTGLVMILANFCYGLIIINDPVMEIPFYNEIQGTVFLRPNYHWSFYLNLFTGIITFFLGVAVYLLDYFVPRKIAVVFHHSVVEEDEFFQVEEEEEEPGLEEYGAVSKGSRATRRGATTRRGRSTRGISKFRQTQRKQRSTVRSSRGGSQRLHEEVQLEEIPPKE